MAHLRHIPMQSPHAPATVAHVPARALDPGVLAAAYEATRSLLHATEAGEAVQVVIDFVHRVGGDVVPADRAPAHALPLDLGLGEVPPLLPVPPRSGPNRTSLEVMLAALVEDARTTVLRLRDEARLAAEASRDPLTGALSRRLLMRRLSCLSADDAVALLDLDHFKALNDSSGHAAGDAALRAFGEVLRTGVREDDIVGRYGGEEFLIGFHGISLPKAVARIEQIRCAWRAAEPRLTFSAGVAAVGHAGLAAAIASADAAMYRAKAAGRDRTEVHDRAA
jgi:diguanylate cyclase (GGDEF)-like protein